MHGLTQAVRRGFRGLVLQTMTKHLRAFVELKLAFIAETLTRP